MAEWLGRGLQNLVHRFNSGSRLHPLECVTKINAKPMFYAYVLKSGKTGRLYKGACQGKLHVST